MKSSGVAWIRRRLREVNATRGDVVYVLRTYPEPSETFIRREIEGLIRVGVPVTIVAAERVETAGLVDVSGSDGDAPAVHFLRTPRNAPSANAETARKRPGAAAISRLMGAVAGDIAHLRAHPRRSRDYPDGIQYGASHLFTGGIAHDSSSEFRVCF